MAEPARRRAGRPRLPDSVKYIRLRENVYPAVDKQEMN